MNRSVKRASAVATFAIVIAACAGGGAPQGGATPPAAGSPAATGGGQANLSGDLELWHSYSSGAGTELPALNDALNKVKAANPGLNVKVTEVPFDQLFNKINTAWGAGEAKPDLFIAPNDSLGAQVRDGLLADLSQYEGQLQNVSARALEGSRVDGKLYMIPESLKAVGLYYDGARVKTPPATTDELLQAVKGGLRLALFDGSDGLYHNFGWWGAFGGQLMDQSGKCIADQGGVVEAYKFLQQLKAAGARFFPKYNDMADGFKQGKFDAIVDGPWALGGYRESVKSLAVAPMPQAHHGPSRPFLGVDGWYINASAGNLELASRFALAMTSPDAQRIFADKAGHIPANETVTVTDPLAQAFAKIMENGFPRPQAKELNNFWSNFGNAQAKILETGADPVKAIADACAAMNKANGK